MAATLTQETGTGSATANTYLTLAEYATFLDERGLTDTTTDDAKTGRIIQAMDWIEARDRTFQGIKANESQALIWPRSYVVVDGYWLDSDEIPARLKSAQAQLVYDSRSTDIYNVSAGRAIIEERVDVLGVKYSDNGDTNVQPIFAKVQALLAPLMKRVGALGRVERG